MRAYGNHCRAAHAQSATGVQQFDPIQGTSVQAGANTRRIYVKGLFCPQRVETARRAHFVRYWLRSALMQYRNESRLLCAA